MKVRIWQLVLFGLIFGGGTPGCSGPNRNDASSPTAKDPPDSGAPKLGVAGDRVDAGTPLAMTASDGGMTPATDATLKREPPSPTPAKLPEGITVGTPAEMKIPNDRPAVVVHAAASTRRAAIYLHGVCGNIHAVDSWANSAAEHVTLIAIRGDTRCADSTRHRWTASTPHLQKRVELALQSVRAARGGLLDVEQVVIFGYSQGATRAIALHRTHPARYPWVILGGLPVELNPADLRDTRSVTLIAGERELKTHIERSLEVLKTAGANANLFLLPQAGHGQYGPRAREIMTQAFEFAFTLGGAPRRE